MEFLVKYVFTTDKNGKFDLLRSCYRDEQNQGVCNLQTPIFGCVDDFANLVAASIDLYHATCDLKYLKQAIQVRIYWIMRVFLGETLYMIAMSVRPSVDPITLSQTTYRLDT